MSTYEHDGLRNFEHLAWGLVKKGVIDEAVYDESVEAYIENNFAGAVGQVALVNGAIQSEQMPLFASVPIEGSTPIADTRK